jgi:hypothetical protein
MAPRPCPNFVNRMTVEKKTLIGHTVGHRLTHTERRSCTRFHLKRNVWFGWQAADGQFREGEGLTRDVSRAGAFIETAETLPIAMQIKMVVTLRGRVNEDMEARLCGAGSVRHLLSEDGAVVGFGAEVVFHTESPAEAG